MRRSSVNALVKLHETELLEDIMQLLQRRYFDEWARAETVEEREKLFYKVQVIEETLTELLSTIQDESGD